MDSNELAEKARVLARATVSAATNHALPHPARPVALFILQHLVGGRSAALPTGLSFQVDQHLAHPTFSGGPLPAGLTVIASLEEAAATQEGTGPSLWYHVSFSRRDRMPEYADIKAARSVMFRWTSTALQVFPAGNQHVNIHEHVLHLWECLAGWENPPDLRQNCPVLGGLGI